MKNIEIEVIERYNETLVSDLVPIEKDQISLFLKVTLIHLEEDIKRVKDSSYLKDLYRRAIKAEEKVLKKQPINTEDFHKFNNYNRVKVKEIYMIAAATVVLIIIAIVFNSIT